MKHQPRNNQYVVKIVYPNPDSETPELHPTEISVVGPCYKI